jgi:hypothetical protein
MIRPLKQRASAVPEHGTKVPDISPYFLQLSHAFWGQCSKSLWTMRNRPDTIFVTFMLRFHKSRRKSLAGGRLGFGEGTNLKFLEACAFRMPPLLHAVLLCLAASVLFHPTGTAQAGAALEERKAPMKFSWVDCQPNCRGWISAVGIVTTDTPKDFDDFARGRRLGGATLVLDSSGGSVNDSITLGRRFRSLGIMTTVGISVVTHTPQGDHGSVAPEAYCESMCVYLLLSGTSRYVPKAAHVRVHQIWMGDRADDAKAASYTAQDLTIVERDIGRLAKYTFDMGGGGDLLSLSLSVPPWEDLHELTPAELRLTNLVTTDQIADVLPVPDLSGAVATLKSKPVQNRIAGATTDGQASAKSSTRTAEATAAPAPAATDK